MDATAKEASLLITTISSLDHGPPHGFLLAAPTTDVHMASSSSTGSKPQRGPPRQHGPCKDFSLASSGSTDYRHHHGLLCDQGDHSHQHGSGGNMDHRHQHGLCIPLALSSPPPFQSLGPSSFLSPVGSTMALYYFFSQPGEHLKGQLLASGHWPVGLRQCCQQGKVDTW